MPRTSLWLAEGHYGSTGTQILAIQVAEARCEVVYLEPSLVEQTLHRYYLETGVFGRSNVGAERFPVQQESPSPPHHPPLPVGV